MAEYCPACGKEHTGSGDECDFCGAYVTIWETQPFEKVRFAEEEEEEREETAKKSLKEYLFQPKFVLRWMLLAALLMFLLAYEAADLLNWIFG